jgi:lipocalin
MPNGDIVVENSGFNPRTGREKSSFGKAKRGKRVGQLRVSFFLFFYSDYNILALDDNYQWALVGSKSPNYLWILSRTPSLPEETLSHILDIATKRGYDTKKLIWVKQ